MHNGRKISHKAYATAAHILQAFDSVMAREAGRWLSKKGVSWIAQRFRA